MRHARSKTLQAIAALLGSLCMTTPSARADLITEITGEDDVFGQHCASGLGGCGPGSPVADPCVQHPTKYNTDYLWTPRNVLESNLQTQCQGTGSNPGTAGAIGQTPRIVSCGEQIECLRFETLADYDGGDWNRSELHLAKELPFRTYHYVGFMFKFPNSVQPADASAYFAQLLWQGAPSSMGNFTTHPVGGFALGNTPNTWYFATWYRRVAANGTVVEEIRDPIWMPNFVPEQWISVVVRIYVDPEGTSSLKFWIDDGTPFSWYGALGYNFPDKSRANFNAKIGIYAAPQPTPFRVYFDEIRLGQGFHEVKPW